MNQTGSFRLAVTIMRAIPLMVIGVMPGFWLLNQIGQHNIGGFRNPVFFFRPGLHRMIALAGIVTRNSIIIVDFIQLGLLHGLSLEEAILNSVSVRLRPILLTSGAAVLGAIPITLDDGLRWNGLVAHLRIDRLDAVFALCDSRDVQRGLREQTRPWIAREHRRKLAASLGQEPSAL